MLFPALCASTFWGERKEKETQRPIVPGLGVGGRVSLSLSLSFSLSLSLSFSLSLFLFSFHKEEEPIWQICFAFNICSHFISLGLIFFFSFILFRYTIFVIGVSSINQIPVFARSIFAKCLYNRVSDSRKRLVYGYTKEIES